MVFFFSTIIEEKMYFGNIFWKLTETSSKVRGGFLQIKIIRKSRLQNKNKYLTLPTSSFRFVFSRLFHKSPLLFSLFSFPFSHFSTSFEPKVNKFSFFRKV